MKIKVFVLLVVAVLIAVSSCSDAEVAYHNMSRAADQFEVFRRVIFYNGITGEYILSIEGYCSIEKRSNGMFTVLVKTEDGKYLKHDLGLSDNVTFFSEQLRPEKVSARHYRVIFKPSVIVPDIDLR